MADDEKTTYNSLPLPTIVKTTGAGVLRLYPAMTDMFEPTTQIARISYPSVYQSAHITKSSSKSAGATKQVMPQTQVKHIGYKGMSQEGEALRAAYAQNIKETTQAAFSKAKDERDKEIEQMQTMLSDIVKVPAAAAEATTTPPEVGENAEMAQKNAKAAEAFGRSKTELQLERPAIAKVRSKSSQPSAAKSLELLPQASTVKKRSYNPVEARQFMEEQRRKRTQIALQVLNKTRYKDAFEKEQIKKRLEELNKNTRRILNKNIRKKRGIASIKEGADGDPTSNIAAKIDAVPANEEGVCINVNISAQGNRAVSIENTESLSLEIHNSEVQLAVNERQIEQREPTVSRVTVPNALLENRRVGLLRKSETKDHSFSAIKEFSFDKENVALEMMTPQLTVVREPRIKETQQLPQNDRQIQPDTEAAANAGPIPLAMRRRMQHSAMREKSTQVTDSSPVLGSAKDSACERGSQRAEPADLPYWLRPSDVQIYPYNFIVAVRRKLEAITNPKSEQPRTTVVTAATSTTDLRSQKLPEATPLSTGCKERAAEAQEILKRRIIADCSESPEQADANASYTIDTKDTLKHLSPAPAHATPPAAQSHSSNENLTKSQTVSDMHANYSSISIQLAPSNSLSEMSSLKSEIGCHCEEGSNAMSFRKSVSQFEEDDTTVSSSIFNSPSRRVSSQDKGDSVFRAPRPVSPLSLDRIDHLRIASKKPLQDAITSRHVSTRRDHKLPPVLKPPKPTDNEDDDIDFAQLLSDFNRSLSQVIQVNEQLKGSLDLANRIKSPERSANSECKSVSEDGATNVYTTDFEQSSREVSKEKNIKACSKERSASSFLNSQQRRQDLIEIAGSVEPLKSPTTDQAFPTLNINLESITNSSADSSPGDVYSTTYCTTEQSQNPTLENIDGEEVSKTRRDLEQRLQIVEDLKSNLRQTLQDSKALRIHEEDEANANEKSVQHSNDEMGAKKSPHQNVSRSKLQSSAARTNAVSKNDAKITTSLSTHHAAADSSQSSPVTAQKCTNDSSASISEDIQHEHESPSQANMHANEKPYATRSPKEKIPKTAKHLNSPPVGGQRSAASSVQPHINVSRGDFLPEADENAVANESHFLAAVTALRKQSEAQHKNEDTPRSCSTSPCGTSMASTAKETTSSAPQHYKSPAKRDKGMTKSGMHSHKSGKQGVAASSSFNAADLNIDIAPTHNDTLSQSSLSYSSVGAYDKLIQKETSRSEQLTALLKMREKAVFDRTRGQIAWLEMQKERYKAKGLTEQISAIRKKQRAILLKMEREREEIKSLLQVTTTTTNSTATTASAQRRHDHLTAANSATSQHTAEGGDTATVPIVSTSLQHHQPPALLSPLPPFQSLKSSRSDCQHQPPRQHQRYNRHASRTAPAIASPRSAPILRADYALETSRPLEQLLQRREADLRRRREHVERLMHWQQRLDQEEAEVLQLERMLMSYNNVLAQPSHAVSTTATAAAPTARAVEASESAAIATAPPTTTTPLAKDATAQQNSTTPTKRTIKVERRLKEIDKSLRELSSISSSHSTVSSAAHVAEDNSSDAGGGGSGGGGDFVRTTGTKLNKLWRRLTSQQLEKFEPSRRYRLCKSDLERLYEEAKREVLREFAQDEERITTELLERSSVSYRSHSSGDSHRHRADAAVVVNNVIVPRLKLSCSPGQSDAEAQDEEMGDGMLVEDEEEEESVAEASTSLPQGNYSPSAAQEDFNQRPSSNCSSTSASEVDWCSTSANPERERAQQNARNLHQFLMLAQRRAVSHAGGGCLLQRSHSDTQIDESKPLRSFSRSALALGPATTSQRNIAATVEREKEPSTKVILQDAHSEDQKKTVEAGTSQKSLESVASSKRQTISNIPSSPSQNSAVKDEKTTIAIAADAPRSAFSKNHQTQTTNQQRASSAGDRFPESRAAEHGSSVSSATEEDVEEWHGQSTPQSAASVITASSLSALTKESSGANFSLTARKTAANASASIGSAIASVLTTSSAAAHTTNATATEHVLSTASDFSAPMEEISVALSQLSLTDVLPTYQSRKSSETLSNIASVAERGDGDVETNVSSNYSSTYTLQFENMSTDMHSSLNASDTPTVGRESEKTKRDGGSRAGENEATLPKSLAPPHQVGNLKPIIEREVENTKDTSYETDFESAGDETLIDDLSLPHFEVTAGTSALEEDAMEARNTSTTADGNSPAAAEVRVKDCLLPPPPPLPLPQPPTSSTASTGNGNGGGLMPDIINELEIRRCQQMLLESEQLKQYEHVTAVPYMPYMREIPNKPPPPYVPPAHGSPMTTIFPSKDRIKDITYRRTHELYCQLLETEYMDEKGEKLPSVMEEKITNIYERIILDICREYLDDHREVLTQGDPSKFYSQLAFFNPPDRLRCIQESIYKEVRRCLAMDKPPPKRNQVYSVYGQRARRDHIGKIIIEEMYDEDDRWCNFHHEENEVLQLIVKEMIMNDVQQLAKEVFLQEGGTIDEDDNAENHASGNVSGGDFKETTLTFTAGEAEESSTLASGATPGT